MLDLLLLFSRVVGTTVIQLWADEHMYSWTYLFVCTFQLLLLLLRMLHNTNTQQPLCSWC